MRELNKELELVIASSNYLSLYYKSGEYSYYYQYGDFIGYLEYLVQAPDLEFGGPLKPDQIEALLEHTRREDPILTIAKTKIYESQTKFLTLLVSLSDSDNIDCFTLVTEDQGDYNYYYKNREEANFLLIDQAIAIPEQAAKLEIYIDQILQDYEQNQAAESA